MAFSSAGDLSDDDTSHAKGSVNTAAESDNSRNNSTARPRDACISLLRAQRVQPLLDAAGDVGQ